MRNITKKFVSVSTAIVLLAMTSGLPQAFSTPETNTIQLIPTFTSVALVNDQLVATGTATATINGRTTTVPITAFVELERQVLTRRGDIYRCSNA